MRSEDCLSDHGIAVILILTTIRCLMIDLKPNNERIKIKLSQ